MSPKNWKQYECESLWWCVSDVSVYPHHAMLCSSGRLGQISVLLNQEEIENLNRPVSNHGIEAATKHFSTKKSPVPNSFTVGFYRTFKDELLSIILRLFPTPLLGRGWMYFIQEILHDLIRLNKVPLHFFYSLKTEGGALTGLA